jgi:excisionase family DNA binding protein
MTIPAYAEKIGSRLPSADEKKAANQLRKILASQIAQGSKLRLKENDSKSVDIVLTPGLSSLLMELLRHIGQGDAVTLVPVGQLLTTQQAADILNVSRPYLISLLEREQIEFSRVGRHRRIRADALFEYKRKRDGNRAEALSELAALDADTM